MSTKSQNKIKIVGLGTSGIKVIDYILEQGVSEVECIAVDTYAVALSQSKAKIQLCIGNDFLHGGGSGGDPRIGQKAAEKNVVELCNVLSSTDQVFIVCGLGGGTGAGASSIIANSAKESGAATIGIVYNPFGFEGVHRQRIAGSAVEKLNNNVDLLIALSQRQIFRQMPPSQTHQIEQVFATATSVVAQEVLARLS